MTLASFGYRAYAEPLGIHTSRGTVAVRRGLHFYVRDEAGRTGWGDAAPWPGSDAELRLATAGLSAVVRALLTGETPSDDPAAIAAFCRTYAVTPEATYAAELAFLDLVAQREGRSVAHTLHHAPARTLRCHALVSDADSARAAVEHGFDTLKVKVGVDVDADDLRLAAIRAAAPRATLRLDANGAWGRDEACWAIERLMRHDIALVEQPVRADLLTDLGDVRRRVPVKVAADESVTGPVALRRILAEDAADVVVLKPMFVGGAAATHALAATCAEAGVPVIVTHALESAVGRAGAVQIAATLPEVCRGEVHGLTSDVRVGPELAVPGGVGLGRAPREAA